MTMISKLRIKQIITKAIINGIKDASSDYVNVYKQLSKKWEQLASPMGSYVAIIRRNTKGEEVTAVLERGDDRFDGMYNKVIELAEELDTSIKAVTDYLKEQSS